MMNKSPWQPTGNTPNFMTANLIIQAKYSLHRKGSSHEPQVLSSFLILDSEDIS